MTTTKAYDDLVSKLMAESAAKRDGTVAERIKEKHAKADAIGIPKRKPGRPLGSRNRPKVSK